MPQETLNFPPAYCIVGAYRLAHDEALWKPMWQKCSGAAKKAAMIAAGWAVVTWPIQKLFVYYFMSGTATVTGMSSIYNYFSRTADKVDDSLPFIIPLPSLTTFAAFLFVLGQCSTIMEFWLRRKLRECRNTAYTATVRSRGKPADWWTEYVEEWEEPPTQKAIKNSKKQAFYLKLATPLLRMVVLKVFLLPLDFVPFLGLLVSSAIRSLSMGRTLHAPLFAAKRMTPHQVELWITERQFQYRAFGLAAALLEQLPLAGIVFSISNRVGAAMYAHDLEKRQQAFRSGELKPLSRSETYSLTDPRKPSSPTSSQKGKLPFAPQADDTYAMPGASMARAQDEKPAYSEKDAKEVLGDTAGPQGNLGLAPAHEPGAAEGARRRVPPIPKGDL